MKKILCAALAIGPLALPVLRAQTARQDVSLIVTNGIVVTMDGDRGVIARGAVAVDGPDVVAVDTAAEIARRFTAGETRTRKVRSSFPASSTRTLTRRWCSIAASRTTSH
jgi:hypothetical protein